MKHRTLTINRTFAYSREALQNLALTPHQQMQEITCELTRLYTAQNLYWLKMNGYYRKSYKFECWATIAANRFNMECFRRYTHISDKYRTFWKHYDKWLRYKQGEISGLITAVYIMGYTVKVTDYFPDGVTPVTVKFVLEHQETGVKYSAEIHM